MSWTVELGPRAARELRKLAPAARLQVLTELKTLAGDPHPPGPKSKRLRGFKSPTYRFRSGDYRAVYRVEGSVVRIAAIFHRRDLEKELGTLR